MGEEFKPRLYALEGFKGKVKADYNEFTQYLTLVLAEGGRMVSFNGIIKDQTEIDSILNNMLGIIEGPQYVELDSQPDVEEVKKLKKK